MPKRILVVEDSPTQAERVRLLLEESGYQVEVARDGQEGLERVRRQPPDLIISDVMMPRMDGYAFCRAVKSAQKTRRIPFVLLTDRRNAIDIITGLERGADNFITKPFEDDYLLERIRRIFEQLEFRRDGHLEMEVALRVGARQIVLSADKQQIIELLFSTFEEMCLLNGRLTASQHEIEAYARDLETRVAERTREFRSLFDNVPVGLYRTTPAGQILEANLALAQLLGYDSVDDLINLASATSFYVDPNDRERLKAMLEERETFSDEDVRFRRRDDALIWVRHQVRALRDDVDQIIGYEGAVQDVTERRRAEQALRSSEALKAAVVEAALDAVITIDHEGRIIEFNSSAERIFSYARGEAIGRQVADLIIPPALRERQRAALQHYLETGQGLALDRRIEVTAIRHDGSEFPAEVAVNRIPTEGHPMFTGFIRDLTQERQAQAELEHQRAKLQHSEKLAAMGSLLAGVAHELNNPLAVVTGQAYLLHAQMPTGPIGARAEKIQKAADRCARIVKNFLALARQQPPEHRETRLNEIAHEALEMLAYPLRVDGVSVDLQLAPDLPSMFADSHQLHQVLVNLVVNAHHAMRGAPGPHTLTLRTEWSPGRERVVLTVADNGPGIPPEIRPRIFEPFFTTKPVGVGTGLGLALCHGIIESHGGTISVADGPGSGAVFVIELPLGAATAVETPPAAPTGEVLSRRVLVVDDETEVADTLADMLRAGGHRVEVASNGLAALDKLRAGEFDLVFSDIRMPELDGPALYRELERTRPELLERFVFATGDTLSAEVREFLEQRNVLSITKPFDSEEILAVVRRLGGKGRR